MDHHHAAAARWRSAPAPGRHHSAPAAPAPGHSQGQRDRRPTSPIENGATLRLLRPAKFVEPDEIIFRANTAKFAGRPA